MPEATITGFKIISLADMVKELGEERVLEILSSFSSPMNRDVENFLKHKAITFELQSISRTKLVFASYRKKPVLVGYFTLAHKNFVIPTKNIGNKLRSRLNKFGTLIAEIKSYNISAPLIAQLSKNFTNDYNKLISGSELLKMACDLVQEVQLNIGGKIAYIECEDKPKLVEFYKRNGFIEFNKRQLDKESEETSECKYYLQLLRYF